MSEQELQDAKYSLIGKALDAIAFGLLRLVIVANGVYLIAAADGVEWTKWQAIIVAWALILLFKTNK